jgi:carboxymethylenebutenolidase
LGGRIALRAAVDCGDLFAAVCPFYGSLSEVDPADIRVPICGSYGELDAGIPAAGVRDFAAHLRVPNDVRVYENAGHAFCDSRRASYVETAAEDAWTRTVEFLRAHLGPPTP